MAQQDYGQMLSDTVKMAPGAGQDRKAQASVLVVFDGPGAPDVFDLNQANKEKITFGRKSAEAQADILFESGVVSRRHGEFFRQYGQWFVQDLGSTNGILCNGSKIVSRQLRDGDILQIGNAQGEMAKGVLILVNSRGTPLDWTCVPIRGSQLIIGRDPSSGICIPSVNVSKRHAVITRTSGGQYVIEDCHSTNGVYVNNRAVRDRTVLQEKDILSIAGNRMIFTGGALYYGVPSLVPPVPGTTPSFRNAEKGFIPQKKGISVEADNVVVVRGRGRKKNITSDHVTLRVEPGELVSIIGGSGAGKSTLLNAMSGYLRPASGHVYINGVDQYQHFDELKSLIGYVPQQDIVFDTLTLYDTLLYTAKLRLPEDTTPEEREAAIDRAIAMVELKEKKKSLIKNLSGGQRKRASIAVELLSDPSLLFLDEPCSGLDPGTERSLMRTLRRMANEGKTIILVTHSTLQLKMCDQIVFMGRHGKLCYCGPEDEALRFFRVSSVVDCYDKMNNESAHWQSVFNLTRQSRNPGSRENQPLPEAREKKKGHLGTLTARYLKLTVNDRSRVALLLALVPIVVVLISLVNEDYAFDHDKGLNITRNMMFVLSCSCFFLGMFGSISEISKERTIVLREYMTGMSLNMYVLSKIIVLGLICLIQSVMITGLFAWLLKPEFPKREILFAPYAEMFITTFLLELSSAATGLLVSAMVSKPDLGVTITVVLLMPQILFSGMTFDLSGVTEGISWLAVARWGMEGFGATTGLQTMGFVPNDYLKDAHPPEQVIQRLATNEFQYSMFERTSEHLLTVWGILAGITVVCLVLTALAMRRIRRDA